MPGFDCHGLPIEHKALKQLEADHRKMEPLEVRKVARKTAEKAIKVQMKEFKEFGIMTDWDNVYRTYGKRFEQQKPLNRWLKFCSPQIKAMKSGSCASSRLCYRKVTFISAGDTFAKLTRTSGLIYRQEKPVLWSPSSRTALAEAEIEYKEDHVSESAYVRFPLHLIGPQLRKILSEQSSLHNAKLNLVIWTTTPWTLPANMVK